MKPRCPLPPPRSGRGRRPPYPRTPPRRGIPPPSGYRKVLAGLRRLFIGGDERLVYAAEAAGARGGDEKIAGRLRRFREGDIPAAAPHQVKAAGLAVRHDLPDAEEGDPIRLFEGERAVLVFEEDGALRRRLVRGGGSVPDGIGERLCGNERAEEDRGKEKSGQSKDPAFHFTPPSRSGESARGRP